MLREGLPSPLPPLRWAGVLETAADDAIRHAESCLGDAIRRD